LAPLLMSRWFPLTHKRRRTNPDRFWIQASGELLAECWIWSGSLGTKGYGMVRINGATRRTHVIAYTLVYGPVETGWDVHHKCETRLCVNPLHLELKLHGEHASHHQLGVPDHICIHGIGISQCVECKREQHRIQAKAWRNKNRESWNAYKREYYRKSKEQR